MLNISNLVQHGPGADRKARARIGSQNDGTSEGSVQLSSNNVISGPVGTWLLILDVVVDSSRRIVVDGGCMTWASATETPPSKRYYGRPLSPSDAYQGQHRPSKDARDGHQDTQVCR